MDKSELMKNTNIQYETPRAIQSPESSEVTAAAGQMQFNFKLMA